MDRGGNASAAGAAINDRSSERAIGRQLALQPLFDRAARLLGQTAGLLLLAVAGSDLDRQRKHLAVARVQFAALRDGYHALDDTAAPIRSCCAVAEAINRLGPLLERLDRRFAATFRSGPELATLLGELSAARAALQAGACPHLGLSIVDLGGACCALRH